MALSSTPRTILVTGANRGLGLELVKQLLSATHPPETLFAAFRGGKESGKGQELEGLLESHNNLQLVSLDVANEESISEASLHVGDMLKGRGLNLLINNAGVGSRDYTLDAVTQQAIRDTFTINVGGPMLVTKAFLPLLKKAAADSSAEPMGWSKAMVMNMASILGSISMGTTKGIYTYGASKAALNHFTKVLSTQVNSDGILAVAIHPGWVRTDMGGPDGHFSTEESVTSLLATCSTFGKDQQGGFFNYDGKPLAY